MNPGLRHYSPPPALTCCAAALLLCCSCSNPLGPAASDYGSQIPPSRLREIEPSGIGKYVKPPAAEPIDPLAAARKRFQGMSDFEVTVEECRASALEHNLDLKVALVDPTIAAERVSQQEALFESSFTTRALWRQTDSPTATELVGSQSEDGLIEPGVTVPLRTGGTANVSLPITQVETNNQFATLNPAYTTDLAFSISQPLLRNAGRRAATMPIRIESYNRQSTEAQTKLEIIRQLSSVDRAYWALYALRRALEVTQQQYELAQAQLDRAERLVKAGRAAEIEVIRSQAGVAERLNSIIVAQNDVLARQRELKRIINLPGLDIDSTVLVVPGTDPDPVEYVIDRAAVAEQAVKGRMELLDVEIRLLADAANIEFRENQALPDLSIDATYRINGLGGSLTDSAKVLRDNDFEDWSIGANLSVPLGNEAAKAQLRQAILTRLQRLSTRDARRLSVLQEVYDAADRIEAGWQRILATRQSVILSTRSLQAEQRQFDVGRSTSTDVLDAASRLAEAQLSEIRSITDYQIAQVDLAAATGTLLGAMKIRWQPSEPDVPVGGEPAPVAEPSTEPSPAPAAEDPGSAG